MSFHNRPIAKASITVAEPVVGVPGYTTEYPAFVAYQSDWTADGQAITDGWTGVNTSDVPYTGSWFGVPTPSGKNPLNVRSSVAGQFYAKKTVTGMTVGQTYTLSASMLRGVFSGPTAFKIGVTGKGYDTPTNLDTETWVSKTYTFTATATSHELLVEGTADGSYQGLLADNVRLTRHAYSVVTPPVMTLEPELSISEGTITMDTTWSPHVQAKVTVPFTSEELLEQIDPDENPGQRVTITASAVGHEDPGPEVIVVPAHDVEHPEVGHWETVPDTYTSWVTQRTNPFMVPRQTGEPGLGESGIRFSWTRSYPTGDGPTGIDTYTRHTSVASTGTFRGIDILGNADIGTPLTADQWLRVPMNGQPVTISMWVRSSVARNFAIGGRRHSGTGTWNGAYSPGTQTALAANTWTRVSQTFAATGNYIVFRAGFPASQTYAAGETLDITGLFIGTGDYFDGETPDPDALSQYAWTGTPNASQSVFQTREVDVPSHEVWEVDTPAWTEHVPDEWGPGPKVWVPDDEREFDLLLRSRTVSHDGKTLELELESDERALQNFAKLTDDLTPRTYEANLRGLVNYVLSEAGQGVLQTGTTNADLTARWSARNMITDPGTAATAGGGFTPLNCQLDVSDTSWSISGDGDSFNLYSPTAADSFMNVGPSVAPFGVQGGKTYVFSATGNVKTLFTGSTMPGVDANRARALVVHYRVGSGPYSIPRSAQVPNVVNQPTRVEVEFTLPVGVTEVVLRAYLGNTAGQIRWDGFRLSEKGPGTLTDNGVYFDGDTTDTAHYDYSWEGVQDASPSNRKATVERLPELFTWEAGVSAWDFLEPLTAAAGLRLFCDEQRRWWLIDPATYSQPGRFTAIPSVTTQGTDTIDTESKLHVDGVVVTYVWEDANGATQKKKDVAGTSGRIYPETVEREYPGPGRAAAILARRSGQGRTQDVTVGVDFRVQPGQEIGISLPGTAYQLGQITRADFGLSEGLMQLGSAGLRETPAGAIDLLPGTIDALPGTIDSL